MRESSYKSLVAIVLPLFLVVGFFYFQVEKVYASKARFITEAFEEVAEQIGRSTDDLVRSAGGREAIEEAGQKITRVLSTTDQKQVAAIIRRAGTQADNVIRVIKNAPETNMSNVIKALDDLPTERVGVAVRRLADPEDGPKLMRLVQRHGSDVLRAEAHRAGSGRHLVRAFGEDGVQLSRRLNADQARYLSRHSDEIQNLSPSKREELLERIRDADSGFWKFLRENPNKIIFTSGAVGIILTNSDRVLGESKVVTNSNGELIQIRKPGFIEEYTDVVGDQVRGIFAPVIWAVAIAVGMITVICFFYFVWPWLKIAKSQAEPEEVEKNK